MCSIIAEAVSQGRSQVRTSLSWVLFYHKGCLTTIANLFFFFLMFIYFERERENARVHVCKQGRGRQRREGIPNRLHAFSVETDTGLDPVNREIMT